MRAMGEEEVERSRRRRGILVADVATALLPSAYAAPTQPYNPPPANLPLANLQTCTLANLHQAAYNYARYQTLALRRAQDRPPDDLLGRSAELTAKPQAVGRGVHRAGDIGTREGGDKGTGRRDGGLPGGGVAGEREAG